MFAFRSTWLIKDGKMDDAFELISTTADKVSSGAIERRLYRAKLGPEELVYEEVWDSLDEHDAAWEAYARVLEEEGFWPKWQEVVERAVGHTMWVVKAWH